MIYLQHYYAESGLPQPATILLEVDYSPLVQREVIDEFAHAFPQAQVEKLENINSSADLIVLVYRSSDVNVIRKIQWGYHASRFAKSGIGFFCVDWRTWTVFPPSGFVRWVSIELLVLFSAMVLDFLCKLFTPWE